MGSSSCLYIVLITNNVYTDLKTLSINALSQVKGLVHPKIKISLCFTHPQCILGVYDFLLLDEFNRSYIKNGLGPSKCYH